MNELKMLTPDTGRVLEKLATSKLLQNFCFVEGSALTFYLSHRYSEDIDLFTWHEQLDTINIQRQIEKNGFDNVKTLNLSESQADFLIDRVKVTFFAGNWNGLKNRKPVKHNLYVAELSTIAVMKVNTLFLRAKFRDYYDLYVLNLKHFTLPELYELTSTKMSNLTITLFQRALIFTKDIEDESIEHLQPKYQVTIQQIEDHFHDKIRQWNTSLKA